MSAPAKPEDRPALVGPMGIFRHVVENAKSVAADLREKATELRRQADAADRQAASLDQLYVIAEPHVPADRQGVLELQKERIA